jgi:hypothetical protein
MAKLAKQHEIEKKLNEEKPEPQLVMAGIGSGLTGKKPMEKPKKPVQGEERPKTIREIMAAIKKEAKEGGNEGTSS